MAQEVYPLDYATTMRVVRDALRPIQPAPVVVSEGANTMDNARWGLGRNLCPEWLCNLTLN